MGLFQEYLDAGGKLKKPVVDLHGGKPTPAEPPVKPPKEHGSAPYIAPKGEKNTKKGLGDLGDTKDFPCKGKEPKPAKIPTAEQVEISALVSDALKTDPEMAETLIYQLKNEGLLGAIVAEMFQHKETFKHLVEVMGHNTYGPKICSRLVRAMNEEVAPPMSDSLQGKKIEDAPEEAEEGDDEEDDFEYEDANFESPLMNGNKKPAMNNLQAAMQK